MFMEKAKAVSKDATALIEEMAKLRKQNALILSPPGSNHGTLIKKSSEITMLLRKVINDA